uniref:protein-serine/threonine phosphatase n=1 Tax=Aegilops tauschii subsp. strangulata TaxID=200361 RepID=A0A453IEC3_AEGTS
MSEIRRDVPEGAGAGAEGKGAESHVGSRAARRRRMEIRRHRLVAERGAEEVSRKRRKLDEESSSTDEEEIEPAKYGVTSVCGRRRDMEDAVSIRPEFLPGHHFFGVFDGHGCSHVATSCGERMHEIVVEEAGGARSSGSDDADRWMGVMERSFARMDAEAVSSRSRASGAPTCRCELQLPKCDHVGSTAVVAVVGPRHLVVANCGDSRAVIGRGGAAIPLSSDHKVCAHNQLLVSSAKDLHIPACSNRTCLLDSFSAGSARRAGADPSGRRARHLLGRRPRLRRASHVTGHWRQLPEAIRDTRPGGEGPGEEGRR